MKMPPNPDRGPSRRVGEIKTFLLSHQVHLNNTVSYACELVPHVGLPRIPLPRSNIDVFTYNVSFEPKC